MVGFCVTQNGGTTDVRAKFSAEPQNGSQFSNQSRAESHSRCRQSAVS